MSTTTTAFPQEPMTLRFATTSAKDETPGRIIRRFVDHVEEATAGAITFDVFYDSTLGAAAEELALVRSGFVDMVCLRLSAFPYQLPLLCLPECRPGEGRTAVDCLDHITFQNRDTVPLIHAEAKANDISYVGFVAGGPNVFVGREPFVTLADLSGLRFGAAASAPARNVAMRAGTSGFGKRFPCHWIDGDGFLRVICTADEHGNGITDDHFPHGIG